jgi:tetratricopeptide (TPR) repeat protein
VGSGLRSRLRSRSPRSARGRPEGAVLVLAIGAALAGCAATSEVTRDYGGRIVQGRYVEPEAYAAFLRGSIAEASGQTADALAAYGAALRRDPGSVEIWTRIAAVRCAASPSDPLADDALAHAFAIDPRFAPAWAVKATCALGRGDGAAARDAAAKAAALDPEQDAANVLLADTATPERASEARTALVALTATAEDPVLAWSALARWASSHGDVALASFAYERLVKMAPSYREATAAAAERLALAGRTSEARRVAAAAVDASEAPFGAAVHPLAARLAVDDAIARRDASLVRRRAIRVRLSLEEAAARAFLAGDASLARAIASKEASADADDRGVRLVLAAIDRRDALAALTEARTVRDPISGAAWVAVAEALAHVVPAAEARKVLAALAHDPITQGDSLVLGRAAAIPQ